MPSDLPARAMPRVGALRFVTGGGISLALADVLGALLDRPERLGAASGLAAALAASTGIGLVLAGGVWTVVRLARRRASAPLLLAVWLGVLGGVAGGRLSGLVPPPGLDPASLIRFSAFLGLVLVLSTTTWGATRSCPDLAERLVEWLCSAAPLLFALGAGAAWIRIYALADAGRISRFAILPVAVLVAATAAWQGWRRPALTSWAAPPLALLALAAPLATLPPAPPPPPAWSGRVRHVLLVSIDTLRADAWAPSAGGLLEHGVVFRNARAPAPWTLPSVASLLTGVSPEVHGATTARSRLADGVPTLAERLAAAGYRTAAFGDNGVIGLAARRLSRGFGSFDFYPRPAQDGSLGTGVVAALFPDSVRHGTEAVALSRRALGWIEDHAHDPWFVWVHYFDPHEPYAPPVASLEGARPPRGMGQRFGNLLGVRAGFLAPDVAQREWIRRLYGAEVGHVSTGLAELASGLERLGLLDEALVVVTADHGEEFWEHGGFEHGHTLFDELLRVPLVVKPPGDAVRTVVDAAVSIEDVAPTVLDVCGLRDEADPAAPRTLRPLWGDPAEARDRDLVAGSTLYYGPRRAVVFDGLKYVRDRISRQEALYDLASDPAETASVASARPDALEQARQRLARHDDEARRLRERLGVGVPERLDLTPEVERHLRALGYLQ